MQVFDRQGKYLGQWGVTGSAPGQIEGSAGVAVKADGNVLVVDTANNRVQLYSPEGELLGTFGAAGSGPGQFNLPYQLTVDASGYVYITDIGNNRVQKIALVN